MTPQELKSSILQLAVQGKLVEHFESFSQRVKTWSVRVSNR